jgi:succinate-semialdehyde dehydrogenase/glutarate-semialdehyde dehydrogenase
MVAAAVSCRISNGGQKCNSSKRFIILKQHYEKFCQKMTAYMSKLVIGDPFDSTTQVTSLATSALVQEIHHQVTSTIAQGARCLTG